MDVKQIYSLVNDALKEVLGEEAILQEDLSNLVDAGDAVFNAGYAQIYSKALINRIGKTVFAVRKYSGRAPSVLMDSWEYGSVKQKISFELSEATENKSWELVDGQSYDPFVYTDGKVTVKYYNKKTTFEVPLSITEEQLKQSFTSAGELNAFVSGIYEYVDTTLTVATDSLIMRTINAGIGETINDDNANRVVKLVSLFNAAHTEAEAVTKANALQNPEFIRFAALKMELAKSRLSVMSKLFNIGGKARFTPGEDLRIVMLDNFKAASDVYLQSDTYHNEFTALPQAEIVPYWQGSGEDYAFDSISAIDVKTPSGDTVQHGGIMAVMFDREALGVACADDRTTTAYNGRAEFTNYWFKRDANYWIDTNENMIVFTLD